jgi:hypothetical protein
LIAFRAEEEDARAVDAKQHLIRLHNNAAFIDKAEATHDLFDISGLVLLR